MPGIPSSQHAPAPRARQVLTCLLCAALLAGSAMIAPMAAAATGAATSTAGAVRNPDAAGTPLPGAAQNPGAAATTLPGSVQEQQVAIPALTDHVTDRIGLLDATQKATLETGLRDFATRTGSQIGILLVSTTAPEAIDQYGIRVAEAWKLGRKGIDDGVILIVARDNPPALRRLRLEVGRGVQGSLTDAQANRILQDVIAPHFRQNDFYGGLVAASAALQTVLEREHLPAPAAPAQNAQTGSDFAGLLPILFIMLVGIYLIGSRMRRGGSGLSSNGWGNTAGVILGNVVGSVISSQLGRSGGGGGFGGGGGGGFSGGGGGFDGGGASGNW